MSEINYQEAYEREHEKCADLADKIVVLESEKEDLQFKLDRIKKNKFWKATGPARSLIHFAQRQRDRLSHCGGPKDILRKIRNKSRQKSLMESYGTGSFPDAEQRKKEEETIFPYMPKISILVPLWNNKREFQIQMLDCVMNQTYPNWELCLADGSTRSTPISRNSAGSTRRRRMVVSSISTWIITAVSPITPTNATSWLPEIISVCLTRMIFYILPYCMRM